MTYNFWDNLMGSDEEAANYMVSYGEGVNCPTRHTLGSFINDGESVLDVGCGPGHNYEHFKTHGPEVIYKGLDYAIRFVRANKQKYPEANFELGDVRDIKETDESWDVVIMQDALEHTNGYERPVREAVRVAKKRCIFTFWHLTESDDHVNDDGDDGYGAWYSRPKWEEFLKTLEKEQDIVWFHYELEYPAGRKRDYYVIEKELK